MEWEYGVRVELSSLGNSFSKCRVVFVMYIGNMSLLEVEH